MKSLVVRVGESLILIFLAVSCTGPPARSESCGPTPVVTAEVRDALKPRPVSSGKKAGQYAPDQVLVRFKDGTQQQAIEAIQGQLHLYTVKVVVRPNLYLMKIQDGSSVEDIIKRLKDFEAVEYSEPNYIRTIH